MKENIGVARADVIFVTAIVRSEGEAGSCNSGFDSAGCGLGYEGGQKRRARDADGRGPVDRDAGVVVCAATGTTCLLPRNGGRLQLAGYEPSVMLRGPLARRDDPAGSHLYA